MCACCQRIPIERTGNSLNLCEEQDRQAWEYLQTMDREKYKSYTAADPYLETREKEDAFLERVETAIRDGVKESVPMAMAKNLFEMLAPFVKEAVGEKSMSSDEELARYYRQVEAACEGAGDVAGAGDRGEGQVAGEKSEDERVYLGISGKDTQDENGKTEAILRELRNARRNSEIKRRNSSFDNRTVRNAEAESIASEEQRRFEEQKRLEEQERARADRRRNKKRSGSEI